MNELTIAGGTEIVEQQTINADLFARWTSYIDAKPKTIETYSKAIKQFFLYLSENGIRQPQRKGHSTGEKGHSTGEKGHSTGERKSEKPCYHWLFRLSENPNILSIDNQLIIKPHSPPMPTAAAML